MNEHNLLNPWLVTGFIDGEGCFTMFVRKDKQVREHQVTTYFRWETRLAITLRGDDIKMLELIKGYFGCGYITLTYPPKALRLGQAFYYVCNVYELTEKIIAHFEQYPLQSKKKND